MLTPCALLLSIYITVTLTYKDSGPRTGSHVQGGFDSVAQQFCDYRIQHRSNDITVLRLYPSDKLATLLNDVSCGNSYHELLSSGPFSSRTTPLDSAHVASASTISNHDTRDIPLCVSLEQGDRDQQDEVLMTQEGQYWIIDDVHCLGDNVRAMAGTLRRSIENR